jgi:hypothetical protein
MQTLPKRLGKGHGNDTVPTAQGFYPRTKG